MGQQTGIQWAHHTWNPWRGCTKVSPGCEHCYAEALSKRNPAVLGEWGPLGRRAIAAPAYWDLPLRWDRVAESSGIRARVFFSLGDPFERRDDLVGPRDRLFATIRATPHLDWLLLTKRPEFLWLANRAVGWDVYEHGMPKNVWLGTSAEMQRQADERIPSLRKVPATVHFLSIEPLLDRIDLGHHFGLKAYAQGRSRTDVIPVFKGMSGIDWCIIGGESGPGARPCQVWWIRELARQCRDAGVPCFVKQLGGNIVDSIHESHHPWDSFPGTPRLTPTDLPYRARVHLEHPKGGDPEEWPEDLRVRELPR